MEVRKAIECYGGYRFFKFFPNMNAIDFGGLFCDIDSLLAGVFCGCNVSALHVWCIKVAMFVSYRDNFQDALLGNLATISCM